MDLTAYLLYILSASIYKQASKRNCIDLRKRQGIQQVVKAFLKILT
jgi:hypothetical protein